MATNSTNVVVDDTNPALVYSGTWVRFVWRALYISTATNVLTIDILEVESQVSTTLQLMVARKRVLPSNSLSEASCQY